MLYNINESTASDEVILEEDTNLVINESRLFRRVRHKQVPEEFKKLAIKFYGAIDNYARKGGYAIDTKYEKNIYKVKKANPQNCYAFKTPVERYHYDGYGAMPKQCTEPLRKIASQCGLTKKVVDKDGHTRYYKKGKDAFGNTCFYCASVVPMNFDTPAVSYQLSSGTRVGVDHMHFDLPYVYLYLDCFRPSYAFREDSTIFESIELS